MAKKKETRHVKVEALITVTVGEVKCHLTRSEAEVLYVALQNSLGKADGPVCSLPELPWGGFLTTSTVVTGPVGLTPD